METELHFWNFQNPFSLSYSFFNRVKVYLCTTGLTAQQKFLNLVIEFLIALSLAARGVKTSLFIKAIPYSCILTVVEKLS